MSEVGDMQKHGAKRTKKDSSRGEGQGRKVSSLIPIPILLIFLPRALSCASLAWLTLLLLG